MGWHECDLCPSEGARNGGEIRAIGADGTRYAAPKLVVHYVTAHRYAPPRAFIDAVLRVTLSPEEAGAEELCLSCGAELRFLADLADLAKTDPARAANDPFLCETCETFCLRPRRKRR